ncbi:MAG: pyridoxal phosphate-dependent aminotransferase [Alphaproteobacteria bacterium]|nr:pyridoxal phosphate-dependent aminotransferase [Alphaproteobacteria bacterium]
MPCPVIASHTRRKRIASRVADIEVSAIKQMAMRGGKVEDVAALTWGVPSFRTPVSIRQAVARALEHDPDIGKYALPDGLPALRHAVSAHHEAITGLRPDPDRNVMITAGNIQGLNSLFHVLLESGDEVIVTDPGFASHLQQIRLCGGVPVFWPMDEAKGWRLDLDRLADLVTERTKAILLVNPSNPTGTLFSETELRRIGTLARAEDLMILLDDPYSSFLYENRDRFFHLASVPGLHDHLVYLFTFSKCHAMSGWRLGYMVVPKSLKREVLKVHDATIICAPRISQVAGLAALTEPSDHLAEFESVLVRRRELICARLDTLDHVFAYTKPEGAYYVFPRIIASHENSWEFALRLLDEARVTVTPGIAFGPSGEHHVRMAFCVDDAAISTAFDRMELLFPR